MKPYGLLILLPLMLGGCGDEAVHPEFSATCRLVRVALHARGAQMREVGEFAASGQLPGVRLVYRVDEGDGFGPTQDLTCRFAGEESSLERANVVSVVLNNLPLSDTRLYIMKRWWLSSVTAPDGR